mmetsp:Transcript_2529/g.4085  ORF Transcript_2529/g.4085 Transcript_2529/m.4085 type:complete len:115 (-) Transcript_2529:145-489(-)
MSSFLVATSLTLPRGEAEAGDIECGSPWSSVGPSSWISCLSNEDANLFSLGASLPADITGQRSISYQTHATAQQALIGLGERTRVDLEASLDEVVPNVDAALQLNIQLRYLRAL